VRRVQFISCVCRLRLSCGCQTTLSLINYSLIPEIRMFLKIFPSLLTDTKNYEKKKQKNRNSSLFPWGHFIQLTSFFFRGKPEQKKIHRNKSKLPNPKQNKRSIHSSLRRSRLYILDCA